MNINKGKMPTYNKKVTLYKSHETTTHHHHHRHRHLHPRYPHLLHLHLAHHHRRRHHLHHHHRRRHHHHHYYHPFVPHHHLHHYHLHHRRHHPHHHHYHHPFAPLYHLIALPHLTLHHHSPQSLPHPSSLALPFQLFQPLPLYFSSLSFSLHPFPYFQVVLCCLQP